MKRPITILIADDHQLFRQGIIRCLEQFPRRTILLEAATGQEAIDASKSQRPDLIFMDFRMPLIDGFDASKAIIKNNPRAKIVVLSNYDSLIVMLNFFKIGVKGFLPKNVSLNELHHAVITVIAGDLYYPEKFENYFLSEEYLSGRIPPLKLSPRESTLGHTNFNGQNEPRNRYGFELVSQDCRSLSTQITWQTKR